MANKSLLDIIIRQKREGKGAKDTEKELGSLKKGFSNLEKAALGAGVALVGAFAAISLKSVMLAGDIEEMESKFEAVFKETAPEAREELEEFARVVNRSRFELMDMASSLQDTFVPLGFARDKAKDLSIELTKLAVDVASFNNAQEPEVMAAFQSAIVGNHEAVRSYGIVITQASLDVELLRMGIEGGAKAADSQEKALARLNIILGATEDAHGDAVKTADSFVNSMKGLKAQIEELQVAYGQALLPLGRDVVKWLSADAEAWILVNEEMQNNTEAAELNVIQKYALFRLVRDEVILQRENEARWRGITEATAGADRVLRNLTDQTLPPLEVELEKVATSTGRTIEFLDAFGRASQITAGKVDTSLTASITGFMGELDFLLGGGAEIQAAFENLKKGVEIGAITEEEGRVWAEGLFVAATDLQIDLGNLTAKEGAENIKETLGVELDEAKRKLDDIDTAFINLNRTIEMEIIVSVGGPGAQFILGGAPGGDGGQTGLDMIVPGGFPGDTFPIRASSGERVTITPAASASDAPGGSGGISVLVTGNSFAGSVDFEESVENALRGILG